MLVDYKLNIVKTESIPKKKIVFVAVVCHLRDIYLRKVVLLQRKNSEVVVDSHINQNSVNSNKKMLIFISIMVLMMRA